MGRYGFLAWILLWGCGGGEGTDPLGGRTEVRLVPSQESLEFGAVELGTEKVLSVDLLNGSSVPVEPSLGLGAVRSCGPTPAPFCVESLPARIAPGSALPLVIRFHPLQSGAASELLLISACAASGCESVLALTGTGSSGQIRCTPLNVDLGELTIGQCLSQAVVCKNDGASAGRIADVTLGPEPGFRLQGEPLGTLEPGNSRSFEIEACPSDVGTIETSLRIQTDRTLLSGSIRVAGTDPRLALSPSSLDFGEVAIAQPISRLLTLSNVGRSPLELVSIEGSASTLTIEAPPARLNPNETVRLRVSLGPTIEGVISERITVRTNDLREPLQVVPVNATARALPPCQAQLLTDGQLGPIEIGRRGSAYLALQNSGNNDCLYYGAELSPESLGFELEAPGPTHLAPGNVLPILVSLVARDTAAAHGELRIQVSGPAIVAPLDAQGSLGFLRVVPDPVDLGAVTEGCAGPTRTVRVRTPLHEASSGLIDAYLQPISGSGFRLAAPLTLPGPLDQPITVEATPGPGANLAELVLVAVVDGRQGQSRIPIRAEGVPGTTRVERLRLPDPPVLDVLFMIDHTPGTYDDLLMLAQGLPAYLSQLNATRVDYRLAVVSSDTFPGGPRGVFSPADDPAALKVITPTLVDPAEALRVNLFADETPLGSETGLEAVHLATRQPLRSQENAGFLRDPSELLLVFFADEDDQSPGSVENYVDLYRALRPTQDPNKISALAIVGELPQGCAQGATAGPRYLAAAQSLSGGFQSYCGLGPDTLSSINLLSGIRSEFSFAGDPDPATLELRIDGRLVAPLQSNGTPSYEWRPASGTLLLAPFEIPEPGSELELRYQARCR